MLFVLNELTTLLAKVILSKYDPQLFKWIVAGVLKDTFINSWKYITSSGTLFSNFAYNSI